MTFKNENAKKFIKALENIPTAKVGVLSGKNSREDSNSNATIGLKHEMGIGVAKRSWLRMPLILKYDEYLRQAGFNEDKVIEQIIEGASFKEMVAKMGIIGVTVIQDAFSTGGFGKWKPHAKGYTNNTGMILVDTQQLRNSIISQVEE
ncbi:hypothetical protein phi1422_0052 [Bdellovibrio phage phi1422]|uniref:hypothetical protein n=1 Tax=Bdellovibrio phage phi1422 TaxID=1127515 RepID=UPI0002536D68|nr:hypothetical protein F395_gp52 [Bdellovibrio phage phi1422]AFC22572.1 hypothetical protein phi1422_0052 [Bdellovibrio phage phi1422]